MSETPPKTEKLFDDDPMLGAFVAYYPSNRVRLALMGAAVLVAVWFVVTVALWNVPDESAAIITVTVITLAALAVGWWALHLWNREVVLYERGFSYRRGSQTAYIPYTEIESLRQKGKRMSYFGGMIRRDTYQLTLVSAVGELMTLDTTFARADKLTRQIEAAITQANQTIIEDRIWRNGERLSFGAGLEMDALGLHHDGDMLAWDDFVGHLLADGALHIIQRDQSTWRRLFLHQLDNIRILLNILSQVEANA